MSTLPLFPLGTVLFPGAQLPLQVFEPRYVQMLRDLTGNAGQPATFGVVAIDRGHEVGPGAATQLHPVGCEAVLDGVARDTNESQPVYRVLVHGARRFTLEGLRATGAPYLVGDVTWLTDDATVVDDTTRATAERLLAEYAGLLGQPMPQLPHDDAQTARDLAHVIVARVALDVRDRQNVLAAQSGREALATAISLLRREIRLVGTLGALPATGGLAGPSLN